jgi:hypothetical protein
MGACVAAIGGAGSSGPNTTPVALSANGTASEQQKVAKIGDAVNAGDLTYKIISVEFKKSISDGLGQVYKPGAGQYLVLDVQVTNNGKEKITMDSTLTKLKDQQGAEYEADPRADPWVNGEDAGFFLEPLNPHATKEGKIVFDVPNNPIDSFTFIGQGGFLFDQSAAIKLSK